MAAILAVVDIFQTRGRSLAAWGVLVLAAALILPRLT